MNDDELMVMIWVMIAMVAYIVRLKWVIRRIKRGKKTALAAATPAAAIAPPGERSDSEIARLKERLHVLERITVDKENSLAREIESLRHR